MHGLDEGSCESDGCNSISPIRLQNASNESEPGEPTSCLKTIELSFNSASNGKKVDELPRKHKMHRMIKRGKSLGIILYLDRVIAEMLTSTMCGVSGPLGAS
jgi:hypothetical protein